MSEAQESAMQLLEKSLLNYSRNNRELAKTEDEIIRLEKLLAEKRRTEVFCLGQEDELNEEINMRLAFFDDDNQEAKDLIKKYVNEILINDVITYGDEND